MFAEVEAAGYTVPEAYLGGWVDMVAGMPLVKFRLFPAGQGIDVDVFLAESAFQASLLQRRCRQMVDDAALWLVSAEDLILLKLIANPPRDWVDVGDILFTQGKLNDSHLDNWAKTLGIEDRLAKALHDATR